MKIQGWISGKQGVKMEMTKDLCPTADFDISGTEPSGYITRVSFTSIFITF
jgi:hypothetical protein